MAKRLTQMDKAIQQLTAQIDALLLARQHLLDQQQKPKSPPTTRTVPLMVEKIG